MVELRENQTKHSRRSWNDIARAAAAEIKMPAQSLAHIEARGFLCHEMMHLLGGCIEFVKTPRKNAILKSLEFFFPIAPICRWIPPVGSDLAQVGCHHVAETVVYRLTQADGQKVVFFVEYKPEVPAGGRYIRSLFNVPQLDLRKFLRPPFTKENQDAHLQQILRNGMTEKFDFVRLTEGAKSHLEGINAGLGKAMWDELSRS